MISAYEFIDRKRQGGEHTAEEIEFFINGAVSGDIPDYQITAWLMAVCINGMTSAEISALTRAMEYSGDVYSPRLDKVCIDKHSTGGVGDKVTLFAAPVCASCGIYVPKMSGGGLGITGGTKDKMNSIPGFSSELDYDDFIEIVKKTGFAVVGHSKNLVPADKRLYGLRSVSATVESIPLIASSIMSKKLATGADGILLDVKVGSGAFMKDEASAEELARTMLDIAAAAGVRSAAVLTDMDKPLGRTVGNAIEVMEAIDALKGEAEENFKEVAYEISAEMLVLAGVGDKDECLEKVNKAVSSGKALECFRRSVELQGGDPRICEDSSLFPPPVYQRKIYAPKDGFIRSISCGRTGMASLKLGAGREKTSDTIDFSAGIKFSVSVGDCVKKGDLLAEIYSSDKNKFENGGKDFEKVFDICDEKVKKNRNVIKIIRND